MANKRQIKKAICRSCGEIAGVCLTTQAVDDSANFEKWDEIVIDAALLQVGALKQVAPHFGKKVKDFPTPRDYRKARREFYRDNEKRLSEYMNENVQLLAKRINELKK